MAGAALFQLGRYESCEETLKRALDSQPDSAVAWQGLVNLYERQDRQEELASALQNLIELYNKSGNGSRLLELLDKLRLMREKQEDPLLMLETWQLYLPGSPYWSAIENVTEKPSPLKVWRSMMEIQEVQDRAFITREIETRRRRLGANTLTQIKAQVMTDIQSMSKLEEYYRQVLALEQDDQKKINVESAYLERLADRLPITPANDKEKIRHELDQLVNHIVKVAPTTRALQLLIDNANIDDVGAYDSQLLQQYTELDNDSDISKAYQWYLDWIATDEITDESFKVITSLAEKLFEEHIMVVHSFVWACYYYGDYTTGKDKCVEALAIIDHCTTTTGRPLNFVYRSIRLCMAHCLKELGIYTGTEALDIYQELLETKPDDVESLFGKGSVLLQQNQLKEALTALEKANQLDPDRMDILVQLGWTMHRLGNSQEGKIYWELQDEHRTDKQYAYTQFIQAAQLGISNAFTYLGHYYRTIELDESRAIKCYQKAYTMDPEDLEAARYLSAHLLTTEQTDAAEALLRHLTQLSVRAGWIWRRLGMLELQSARSTEAINSFQRALRDDSNDAASWEGLGEAYMRQGRYTASVKAYKRAVDLDVTAMPALLGMAEVYIKLGLHADAIVCYKQALDGEKKTATTERDRLNERKLLPAWVGLADAYAVASRDHWSSGFYGRAAEDCQQALGALSIAAKLATSRQRLGCIWKTAGDVCLLGEKLSVYTSSFSSETLQQLWISMKAQPTNLQTWTLEQLNTATVDIDDGLEVWQWHDTASFRSAITQMAILSYTHAMQDWNDTELCNDLSLAFYRLHFLLGRSEHLLKAAIDCARSGIRHKADSACLWNLLGVYMMRIDARISQHAFIQAIRLDDKDPRPWTNYGYLCLYQSDVDLAKEAFTTAQTLDPECVSAWIGRALLVQSDNTTESLRLFEHALDLAGGISAEAVHGLSREWLKSDTNTTSNPLFALRKHLEGQPDDTAAWNLYTLLLEWSQLHDRALLANDTAITTISSSLSAEDKSATDKTSIVDAKHIQHALQCNRARLLSALHRIDKDGSDTTAIGSVVRGITQFFCNKLEDSLSAFEKALTLAANHETQRAQVVLWLAQVLWALGTPEHQELAKQQLFSILGENTNLDAITCLFVIGLVSDDATLATTALGELVRLPIDTIDELDTLAIADYLKSRFAIIQGSTELARRALAKSIHRHPGTAVFWARLHALLAEFEITSIEARRSVADILTTFPVLPAAPGVSSNTDIACAFSIPDIKTASTNEDGRARRELQRALFKSPWLLNSVLTT
ncbi:hypothetical protein BDF19DRAFT_433583 [Syncephalis fuscata]|nr:hypothetical protein BDF19DRAFT_433583 [Syncephalis fuscata]